MGGWERGCTALLELRKAWREGRKKKRKESERERESALVLRCDECEARHKRSGSVSIKRGVGRGKKGVLGALFVLSGLFMS